MIEDTIRRFIVDELNPNRSAISLSDDYPLLDQGVLDSLGLFQLVSFLEDEFAVEVQDEELVPQHFGTINSIAELVRTKGFARSEAMTSDSRGRKGL
jgi:acyl carrier protein